MWTVWTAGTSATLLHLGPLLLPWTPVMKAAQSKSCNSTHRHQLTMKSVAGVD